MKKLRNTEAEVKKRVAYKKSIYKSLYKVFASFMKCVLKSLQMSMM